MGFLSRLSRKMNDTINNRGGIGDLGPGDIFGARGNAPQMTVRELIDSKVPNNGDLNSDFMMKLRKLIEESSINPQVQEGIGSMGALNNLQNMDIPEPFGYRDDGGPVKYPDFQPIDIMPKIDRDREGGLGGFIRTPLDPQDIARNDINRFMANQRSTFGNFIQNQDPNQNTSNSGGGLMAGKINSLTNGGLGSIDLEGLAALQGFEGFTGMPDFGMAGYRVG